jgi:hypothetical protein
MNESANRVALLPPHSVLNEPLVTFAPGPNPPTSQHPLIGLQDNGHYAAPPSKIRVATITATGDRQLLYNFLGSLRNPYEPGDRRSYVPRYGGFEAIHRAELLPATSCHVDIKDPGDDPHEDLVQAVEAAIDRLRASRDDWDVIAFLLPSRWEHLRTSPDGKYELHDRIKAYAAPRGCPVQMLRQSSALAFKFPCSLAWRLSIALAFKAGAIPWHVRPTTDRDTAYVGLAYAIRGGSRNDFVTCCSQVFDAEGGGLEFVAYNVGAERDLDNPHLTQDEMRAVMARSARLYQQRRAGRMPQRVVLHKTTAWRDEEVDGCLEAWSAATEVECLRIQARTPWRGAVLNRGTGDAANTPHNWPVERGTFQHLSDRSALLWVSGVSARMSLSGGRYNPNVKGIPEPCLVTRYAGSGSLELAAADVLALSKLNWNNDAPYDFVPATISTSSQLAKVIGRVPDLPDSNYEYRLFM